MHIMKTCIENRKTPYLCIKEKHTMSTALAPLANIDNGTDLITTLKQTAFKGNATEAQLAALLIVAY